MNNSSEKKQGIALIIFTILLVFTMGLHPSGGSVAHLISITRMIVITHAIAILSLPFGWVGFQGLTKRIGSDNFGSMMASAMMALGLVAVMLAAATNGIVLPIFLQHYEDASPEKIESIKPILRYSFAINHAFDYIYTVAFCLAILSWSIAILITKRLPVWLGWLGILVSVFAAVIFFSGMAVNNLQGFRVFVTSMVVWILLVGIVLCRKK